MSLHSFLYTDYTRLQTPEYSTNVFIKNQLKSRLSSFREHGGINSYWHIKIPIILVVVVGGSAGVVEGSVKTEDRK